MPRKVDNAWRAFDAIWFNRHQRRLLWLCNAPVVRWWFRWVIGVYGFVPRGARIEQLLPNTIVYGRRLVWTAKGFKERQTGEFFRRAVFSRCLYARFKWLWWALHYWDSLLADRWAPQWGFGFTTLIAYPNFHPETVSCDGMMRVQVTNQTWATVRDAAASTVIDDDGGGFYFWHLSSGSTTNRWNGMDRSGFLFSLSVPANAVIDSAAIHLTFVGKQDELAIAPLSNIYSFAPASNTGLEVGDFNKLGTTPFSDNVTYASIVIAAYTVFPLNTAGRAAIPLGGGVAKYGGRAVYDALNAEPTWAASKNNFLSTVDAEDITSPTIDPKLVVVYDTPPSIGSLDDLEMNLYYCAPNTAIEIKVPIRDSNRGLVQTPTSLDSEIAKYSVGETPGAYDDCSGYEAVALGDGTVKLAVPASDTNKDFSDIIIRSAEGLVAFARIITCLPAQTADGWGARNIAGGANSSPTNREALWTIRGQVVIDPTALTITVKNLAGTTIWSGPITLGTRNPLKTIEPTS